MTTIIISLAILLTLSLLFLFIKSKSVDKNKYTLPKKDYDYKLEVTDNSYILSRPKRVFNIRMKYIKHIEQCYHICKQLELNILEFEDKNNLVKLATDNGLDLEYHAGYGKVKTITARFLYLNDDGTQRIIKVVTKTDRTDLESKLKTILEYIKTNPIQSSRSVGGWMKVINEK